MTSTTTGLFSAEETQAAQAWLASSRRRGVDAVRAIRAMGFTYSEHNGRAADHLVVADARAKMVLAAPRAGGPLTMTETNEGEVFVLRVDGEPCWKVRWAGLVCSPEWQERGPALAYLSLLRKGRKPEVRP